MFLLGWVRFFAGCASPRGQMHGSLSLCTGIERFARRQQREIGMRVTMLPAVSCCPCSGEYTIS